MTAYTTLGAPLSSNPSSSKPLSPCSFCDMVSPDPTALPNALTRPLLQSFKKLEHAQRHERTRQSFGNHRLGIANEGWAAGGRRANVSWDSQTPSTGRTRVQIAERRLLDSAYAFVLERVF